MNVTREEIAAFADGQLAEPRLSEVAAAVATDPWLTEEVARHRALKDKLVAHFAPILDAPLPKRLTAPLGHAEPKVVDLTAARQKLVARGIPRWGWIVAPALAASLALAVFLQSGVVPQAYASPQLALSLDRQLIATQGNDVSTRILLSFRNDEGQFCRAFSGQTQSGIACKDATGWRLRATAVGGARKQSEYQMAASTAASLMAKVETMAVGPALSAEEEQAAKAKGWR
jgi:hypothetical protein